MTESKQTQKERLEEILETTQNKLTDIQKDIYDTQNQIDDLTNIKRELIQDLFFYTEQEWKTKEKLIKIGANKQ